MSKEGKTYSRERSIAAQSQSHPRDCSLFTFYNLPCPYKFTFRPLFYLFWQDKVICHKVLRLPCLPCTVIQLYLGKWRCSRYCTLVSLITSWQASTQARDHVHSTAYSNTFPCTGPLCIHKIKMPTIIDIR